MKNFVIIGPSGYIAKRHLKAIKNLGGTITGYHDLHESTFEGQNSETKFLDSLDAIKDFISNHSVDFLIVCSPNFLHFQHIKIGLESGVNVICEKPIVLNMDNFHELSILEDKYNKKVYTIYQLRLHEINKQMKNFVRSGSKSRLLYVAHRDESYLNSWKVDPDKSGGILFNLGIHYFDFLISHYGEIESFHVEDLTHLRAEGTLQFNMLSVSWLFSIDPQDVQKFSQPVSRIFSINDRELDFSQGFDDLHKLSYKKILEGEGFGLEIAYPSIDLLTNINQQFK